MKNGGWTSKKPMAFRFSDLGPKLPADAMFPATRFFNNTADSLGFKIQQIVLPRWWFQIFLIFIPTWGNDPKRLYCYTPIIMVQWELAGYLKGNDPTGDTPMTSMMMGGSVKSRVYRKGSYM